MYYPRTEMLEPLIYYPRTQLLGPLNYYPITQVLKYYPRTQVLRPLVYYPSTTSRTRAQPRDYRNSSVGILNPLSPITSGIRITFPHYRNRNGGILNSLSQYHLRNSSFRTPNLVSQNCVRKSCNMPPTPNFNKNFFELLKILSFSLVNYYVKVSRFFICPWILLNLYQFCLNILRKFSKSVAQTMKTQIAKKNINFWNSKSTKAVFHKKCLVLGCHALLLLILI